MKEIGRPRRKKEKTNIRKTFMVSDSENNKIIHNQKSEGFTTFADFARSKTLGDE